MAITGRVLLALLLWRTAAACNHDQCDRTEMEQEMALAAQRGAAYIQWSSILRPKVVVDEEEVLADSAFDENSLLEVAAEDSPSVSPSAPHERQANLVSEFPGGDSGVASAMEDHSTLLQIKRGLVQLKSRLMGTRVASRAPVASGADIALGVQSRQTLPLQVTQRTLDLEEDV